MKRLALLVVLSFAFAAGGCAKEKSGATDTNANTPKSAESAAAQDTKTQVAGAASNVKQASKLLVLKFHHDS